MKCALQHNSYGKSMVRVTKVTRDGNRHRIQEMSVDIEFEGAFSESYTIGDNSSIVATDSMKNTVYVLAAENRFDSPEEFAILLAKHFLCTYDQVTVTTIDIAETIWQRIDVEGKPHDHAFTGGQSEKRRARIRAEQGSIKVESGIEDLAVLKTTNSGFVGFVRDRYTTLAETTDRIFATNINCWWLYDGQEVDYNAIYNTVRKEILNTFSEHQSLAVQQTLQEMAGSILDSCSQVTEVNITLPNQHRIPFDLSRFQMENRNEIFIPTPEPYGLINGRITRSSVQADGMQLAAGARES